MEELKKIKDEWVAFDIPLTISVVSLFLIDEV